MTDSDASEAELESARSLAIGSFDAGRRLPLAAEPDRAVCVSRLILSPLLSPRSLLLLKSKIYVVHFAAAVHAAPAASGGRAEAAPAGREPDPSQFDDCSPHAPTGRVGRGPATGSVTLASLSWAGRGARGIDFAQVCGAMSGPQQSRPNCNRQMLKPLPRQARRQSAKA
jgi:hypothetical protein